jgi:hypothetical protein
LGIFEILACGQEEERKEGESEEREERGGKERGAVASRHQL